MLKHLIICSYLYKKVYHTEICSFFNTLFIETIVALKVEFVSRIWFHYCYSWQSKNFNIVRMGYEVYMYISSIQLALQVLKCANCMIWKLKGSR